MRGKPCAKASCLHAAEYQPQEMNKTWLLSTPTAACPATLHAATREVAPAPISPPLTLPQAAKPNAGLTGGKPQVPFPRAMRGGGG
jgi:hypothetical protein